MIFFTVEFAGELVHGGHSRIGCFVFWFHTALSPQSGVRVQKFLELDEDTKFICSWDEEQFIAKGGFVNVSDLSDIYGIARGEFFDTYKECDAEGNFLN